MATTAELIIQARAEVDGAVTGLKRVESSADAVAVANQEVAAATTQATAATQASTAASDQAAPAADGLAKANGAVAAAADKVATSTKAAAGAETGAAAAARTQAQAQDVLTGALVKTDVAAGEGGLMGALTKLKGAFSASLGQIGPLGGVLNGVAGALGPVGVSALAVGAAFIGVNAAVSKYTDIQRQALIETKQGQEVWDAVSNSLATFGDRLGKVARGQDDVILRGAKVLAVNEAWGGAINAVLHPLEALTDAMGSVAWAFTDTEDAIRRVQERIAALRADAERKKVADTREAMLSEQQRAFNEALEIGRRYGVTATTDAQKLSDAMQAMVQRSAERARELTIARGREMVEEATKVASYIEETDLHRAKRQAAMAEVERVANQQYEKALASRAGAVAVFTARERADYELLERAQAGMVREQVAATRAGAQHAQGVAVRVGAIDAETAAWGRLGARVSAFADRVAEALRAQAAMQARLDAIGAAAQSARVSRFGGTGGGQDVIDGISKAKPVPKSDIDKYMEQQKKLQAITQQSLDLAKQVPGQLATAWGAAAATQGSASEVFANIARQAVAGQAAVWANYFQVMAGGYFATGNYVGAAGAEAAALGLYALSGYVGASGGAGAAAAAGQRGGGAGTSTAAVQTQEATAKTFGYYSGESARRGGGNVTIITRDQHTMRSAGMALAQAVARGGSGF